MSNQTNNNPNNNLNNEQSFRGYGLWPFLRGKRKQPWRREGRGQGVANVLPNKTQTSKSRQPGLLRVVQGKVVSRIQVIIRSHPIQIPKAEAWPEVTVKRESAEDQRTRRSVRRKRRTTPGDPQGASREVREGQEGQTLIAVLLLLVWGGRDS